MKKGERFYVERFEKTITDGIDHDDLYICIRI